MRKELALPVSEREKTPARNAQSDKKLLSEYLWLSSYVLE